LATEAFDLASDLAEQRLGMSSLKLHGAHEVARYMPKGMQDAGAAMHHAASRFSVVAKDASVTGDLKPVLASLAKLNQTCVACHAAYKLN
jgi:cytochrome c556